MPHIIHLVVGGSADKQHLQTCLEEGLCLADNNNLQSISIPAIGTGGFGLSAHDSARIVFQALRNFTQSCTKINKIRIVVFQGQMMQAFQQEHMSQGKPGLPHDSPRFTKSGNLSKNFRLRLWVIGGNKPSVEQAIEELNKVFSNACVCKKVDNEGILSLSETQINHLEREAHKWDMELTIDNTKKRITVRGYHNDISDTLSMITDEISKGIKREKHKEEDDNARTISTVVQWSYCDFHGKKTLFDLKTNAQLEEARSKKMSTVKVSLNGKEFDIDLKANTGCCRSNGEQITITRTSTEGNYTFCSSLPENIL